jgi:hypothetical protein
MSNEPFNPYASPAHVPGDFTISTDAHRAKLREIAEAQVFLMQILLVAVIVGFAILWTPTYIPRYIDQLPLIVYACVQLLLSALQAYAMFRLGKAIYSKGAAIGMAIASFIPCLVGLLFMLIANQTATARLNRGGIKVGFLGADLKQFNRFAVPQD